MAHALGIFPTGSAVVQATGIYFDHTIYTCDVAIREQWFSSALTNGQWNVSVFYDRQSDEYIFVKLINGELCIAYKVDDLSQTRTYKDLQEEYYRKLNQLKLKLRQRKSKGRKL